MKNSSVKFDFWYGDSLEDVTSADCFFYPNAGYYAGNMFHGSKAIGDYTTTDSVELGKVFPGIFGN